MTIKMVPQPETRSRAIVAIVSSPLTLLTGENAISGMGGKGFVRCTQTKGAPNPLPTTNRAMLGQAAGEGNGLGPDLGHWMTNRSIVRLGLNTGSLNGLLLNGLASVSPVDKATGSTGQRRPKAS